MSQAWEKELGILLQILKRSPQQSIPGSTFNADLLLQLSALHHVNYQLLVYAQGHPGFMPKVQMDRLTDLCRKNAIRSLEQMRELIWVSRAFQDAGISFVVIKGPQLAGMIYGREALKESVDLDIILVDETGLDLAHPLLTRIGYVRSNLNTYKGKLRRKIFLIAKREVHYFNPGNRSHIDLHIRAGSNTYLTAPLFRNIFAKLETYDLEGCSVYIMPPEEYLVYLCYHGSLHRFSRLAWLLDIRGFLSLKRDMLDYKRVMSFAREIRTEKSVFIAMALLQELFGDVIPDPLNISMNRKRSFNFLVNSCIRQLSKEPRYGLTFRGRLSKLIYMMLLIKGMAGRIDLLYGIFMRFLAQSLVQGSIRKRIPAS